jgi:hypothetical protein
MARKRKPSRTAAPRKPVAADDDLVSVALRVLGRQEEDPAFKARLAAAEHDPKWLRFKEQFKRIADEHEQAKQPKTGKPKVPPEWQDAVAKHTSAPPSALQSIRDTLTDIRDALTKDASSAPQWSGTMEDFLITVVFPEHPIQLGEVVWSDVRDTDYSRRITDVVWDQYRMRVIPWTVKNAWPKRLKK